MESLNLMTAMIPASNRVVRRFAILDTWHPRLYRDPEELHNCSLVVSKCSLPTKMFQDRAPFVRTEGISGKMMVMVFLSLLSLGGRPLTK
jgi:hypothetical protein